MPLRGALAGLTALSLLLAGVTTATAAGADHSVVSGRSAPSSTTRSAAASSSATGCDPAAQRASVRTAMARIGRADDQPGYRPRRLRRLDARLRRRVAARSLRSPEARYGLVLRIPVAVHVLAGKHDRGPSRARVRREIRVLNDAYGGGQSAENTATRFSFQLVSFDRTVNRAWHTAVMFDAADKAARRALHVGGPNELNLYVASPTSRNRRSDGVVLGWSSMPWRAQRRPRLDGVTVHEGSLPGGRLRDYNRGDTAVHEIGHWLGLFHTFEGGCSKRNDRVADTPAEYSPSTACERGRDTCPAPGLDPIHNFMDYSFDACMNRFTPGQVNRMTDNWLAYRTP
ncbi:MAG TPA: zinc metalloprotease [Nocardioidaceae bacterium]|nr:zinc metalloprotease [Nocardioidaceae bacterium]